MSLPGFVDLAYWFFLAFFVGLNGGYILLNLMTNINLRRQVQGRSLDSLPRIYSGFEIPVSILVPAHNETFTIAASIYSLLQLNYPEYEIVVVNDGSKDATLARLICEFDLKPFPQAYRERLATKPVRAIYASARYPNLRVIDKRNGGKADALNVGINASRYPMFCAIDADSILERDSLQRVMEPFLEDPLTIAAGGTVRIANGCTVEGGFITRIGLPTNVLALLQVVEYLRAFLFGRLGWTGMNAVLIISGAFGIFRKEAVVAAGGYRSETSGEDMELVVRLHRIHRLKGIPYRITYVPDPICWTEAPESLKVLQSQRIRWQRGLAESLSLNRELLFHPKGGTAGWLAFPFMAIFEWWGPLIEVLSFVTMTAFLALGLINWHAFAAFLIVSVGFGVMLSVSALLLEEISFHTYPRPRQLLVLAAMVLIENFGYRQLNSIWRVIGLYRWVTGAKQSWGIMHRNAKSQLC